MIRLPHTYQNRFGEDVNSWYVIDCADATAVMQKNEATGKQSAMRLVQLMAPSVVQPHVAPPQDAPLPPEPPADPEGAADTQIAG
jgi:hypothetical protein